jgi:hypothetical protein
LQALEELEIFLCFDGAVHNVFLERPELFHVRRLGKFEQRENALELRALELAVQAREVNVARPPELNLL